jgi:hypothetical protein
MLITASVCPDRPRIGVHKGRHVREIMLAVRTAAREGRTVTLTTSFSRS